MTSAPQFPSPTWMVGAGRMGGAMLDGWRQAGLDLSPVTVIRPSGTPTEGLTTTTDFSLAGPPPRLVVLAFKPQTLDDVAPLLRPWITSKTIIVSILAGVEEASLRNRFAKAGAIVRAMPNLPVAVRRGVVALFSGNAGDGQRQEISNLFAPLGFAPWMKSESGFDAVGSIAGAGPAYVARFVAALAKAGEKSGLSAEMAATIALETVLGTSWMAAASNELMDAIARRVASPGGTTEAGLAVLDRDLVLDDLIAVTLEAAARREAELAAHARDGGAAGGSLAAEAPLA